MVGANRRSTRHTNRRLVSSIILILLLFNISLLYGQSQDDIRVFLQSEPVIEGEVFSVYLEVKLEYGRTFRFGSTPVQDRIRYWGGPASVPAQNSESLLYRFYFYADQAGFALMRPFTLIWPDREIQSKELLVPITVDGITTPAELEWQVPEHKIYVGQTTYLSLDMFRASQILLPESLEIAPLDEALLEEVTGLGSVETDELGGKSFNRISLATFLYTPLRDGQQQLPEVEVFFDTYSGIVESLTIDVLPIADDLPSAAVGNFTLFNSLIPESIVASEEFIFELTIQGTGSLSILNLPELSILGASIEVKEEVNAYIATEFGYSGEKTTRYRLRTEENPLRTFIEITIPEFSWFDPEIAQLQTKGEESYRIEIIPPDISSNITFDEYTSKVDLGKAILLPLSRGWRASLLILFIPVYCLVFISVKKNWNKRNAIGFSIIVIISLSFAAAMFDINEIGASIQTNRESYFALVDEGNNNSALQLGNSILEQEMYNARFLFSLAQLEYKQGNLSRAMLNMRRALSIYPLHKELRDALRILEDEMNLSAQHPILRNVHGDISFLVIYACLIVFISYLLAHNFTILGSSATVVASVLVIVIFAVSLVFHNLYYYAVNRQAAVVPAEGAVLRKIPDAEASDWIYLLEGTTLVPGISALGFIQVETAEGIVAWIQEDTIYRF